MVGLALKERTELGKEKRRISHLAYVASQDTREAVVLEWQLK